MFLIQIVKTSYLVLAGTDTDLEYYVRECGEILAINNKLPADKRDAKHILEYVLHQVVEFKKLNQVSKFFELILGNIKIYVHWLSVFNNEMALVVKFLPHKRQGTINPECSTPCDARTQGIRSHGIDLVFLEYYDFCTRRVKTSMVALILNTCLFD